MMFSRNPFCFPYPKYYIPHTYNNISTENIPMLPSSNMRNNNSKEQKIKTDNPQLFNIFGITVEFDDLLIIFILIFLYLEGTDDEFLFMSLILLLIS